MCKWDIFLFDCGCFIVQLKDPCHDRRHRYHLNCVQIQQVRKEWVYCQGRLCDRCKKLQDEGYGVCDELPAWKDLQRAAYQVARDRANMGYFE
ncbi:hypothetical protein CEP53_012362 [Fusarium sp. AF-6]|nr:hypothetical protein CEP53_012362 [Fusarium sp. AF-6]